MNQYICPADIYHIPDDLVDYINTTIIPQYESFDAAHRTDHAVAVIERSLIMAHNRNLSCPMAFTIASFHDLGLTNGREFHHRDSAIILAADKQLCKWFSPDEIAIMCDAVEDHRASRSTPPRSIFGCIVAEADRLLDPLTTISRTILYGLSHYPTLDREGQFDRTIEHLNTKYGEQGYIKLWLDDSPNAKGLSELRHIISDKKLLQQYFSEIYDKFTK